MEAIGIERDVAGYPDMQLPVEYFTDAATALPVQIFLWADSPERGFVEKVSGAILVLLTFLLLMNAGAIVMRQKFEKRW